MEGDHMNALELLSKDHDRVSQMLEELSDAIETGSDRRYQRELFSQLRVELETHTRVEQEHFYPAVRRGENSEELILEAMDEHSDIKQMIEELGDLQFGTAEWEDTFLILKENVEFHIQSEESQIFTRARELFSIEQLEDMGRLMEAEKRVQKKAANR
jgi:hemerythrin superfamily protein